MAIPSTYLEWTQLLERFGKGDDSVLQELEHGLFELDAGTVYRFCDKVQTAYMDRKKLWVQKFGRMLQVRSIKTENEFSIILQAGKSNLKPIMKFTRLSAFPKELRDTLGKDFGKALSRVNFIIGFKLLFP